jgi:hypothetical protein
MFNIFVNPTNEFHILRHFKSVNNKYKKSLIWKDYFYYDYDKSRFDKRSYWRKKIYYKYFSNKK